MAGMPRYHVVCQLMSPLKDLVEAQESHSRQKGHTPADNYSGVPLPKRLDSCTYDDYEMIL